MVAVADGHLRNACGRLVGVGADRFEPDREITRAELCAVASRVKSLADGNESNFVDINDHWARTDIEAMFKHGYISGYDENGVPYFKPDKPINRGETVSMINRVEERPEDYSGDRTFFDVPQTHWAYKWIMNAANGYYATGV
ncbi:hypothetical protein FACS189492_3170 [Clostridia bacterium]|nr:hypothetical protein FACS189492_3170 [Clostridia bacterium]